MIDNSLGYFFIIYVKIEQNTHNIALTCVTSEIKKGYDFF